MKNTTTTMAIPFITYDEHRGFQLNPQAEQFLTNLSQDRQLGVISIVGKYRTGKSFFVNRVLLQQTKGGFQVGPTINPCTKGLWLWKKTIINSENQKMDIILIDTEGFGGMDENANHDSRIFLFSLLLSSYFIYNSVGSIDENALNTLNLIINLAKDIQTKTNNHHNDFPSFLWVVRDFTLQIVDKNGNKVNSKQYLENALELQKGNSEAVENKNNLRKLFKQYFNDRDCYTMVRPVEREKDLQRLDQMDNSLLRPQFVTQAQLIRKNIFQKVKPKNINNKTLNGNLLVTLCKAYMEAINKGLLPNVESAWFYVCRNEGMKGLKVAIEYLQRQLDQICEKPLSEQQASIMKKTLRDKVLQQFHKKVVGVDEGHPDLLVKLQNKINEGYEEFGRRNHHNWINVYREKTQDKIQNLRRKVYADQYDNFSQFLQEYEQIKQQYDEQTKQGDNIQKWQHFTEVSQNLYKLAAETITKRINDNLLDETNHLKSKLEKQEEVLQSKKKQMLHEKQTLRSKVEELQKNNLRLQTVEQTNNNRVDKYKQQYDTLYDKYKVLYNDHEETLEQVEKLKRQLKRSSEKQNEQYRNEVVSLKSTVEKERALYQMQKKYLQEELSRMKQRNQMLENDNKKTRTSLVQLSTQWQQLQSKYQHKQEQNKILQSSIQNYTKKIQTLISENSKKSELMGDHHEWLLQKSYLQNQVTFLKSTLNQNKKLHDALLVALQQSIVSSQGDGELVQANRNITLALEKVQNRCKLLQQKYDRVKQYKKIVKNCQAVQCKQCMKWIEVSSFYEHMQACLQLPHCKTEPEINKENLHISLTQIIVRENDHKKPYTEYTIHINYSQHRWKINKKYKQFIQLQESLITQLPSIKYPKSCNFLADINTLVSSKKNIMAEERRKSLQQYLRDLIAIEEVRNNHILQDFLQMKQHEPKSNQKGKRLN